MLKSVVVWDFGAGRDEKSAEDFEGGFESSSCWGCFLGFGVEMENWVFEEDDLGGGREEKTDEDEKEEDWGFGRDEKREDALEDGGGGGGGGWSWGWGGCC